MNADLAARWYRPLCGFGGRGVFGLLRAARTWTPACGVPFEVRARRDVHHAMVDEHRAARRHKHTFAIFDTPLVERQTAPPKDQDARILLEDLRRRHPREMKLLEELVVRCEGSHRLFARRNRHYERDVPAIVAAAIERIKEPAATVTAGPSATPIVGVTRR